MRHDANPTHQRQGGTGRARLLTGEVAMALMHEAPARRGRATTRRPFWMSMALLVCWMGVLSTWIPKVAPPCGSRGQGLFVRLPFDNRTLWGNPGASSTFLVGWDGL